MVSTTLIIEREVDDARSIRDASASDKKRGSQASSSGRERSKGLLLQEGFKGGQRPTGPKPGSGYQSGWADDMFPLPLAETHEVELSVSTRVSGSGDVTILIISGTWADSVCSSLPQHGPREQVSVSGCDTSIRCFTDRPKGLEYGSRSRAECTGWACLGHYSTD